MLRFPDKQYRAVIIEITLVCLVIIFAVLTRVPAIDKVPIDRYSREQILTLTHITALDGEEYSIEGINDQRNDIAQEYYQTNETRINPGDQVYISTVWFIKKYFLQNSSTEFVANAVNILFFTLAALFLYLLQKKFVDTYAGIISLFVFVSLPFLYFFSISQLPVMFNLSLMIMTLFFLIMMTQSKKRLYESIWGIFGTTGVILTTFSQPILSIFFLTPLIYSLKEHRLNFYRLISFYVSIFAIFTSLIIVIFKLNFQDLQHLILLDESIENLFIRHSPPEYFFWIFFERINNIILGGILSFFIILTLFIPKEKSVDIIILLVINCFFLFLFQGDHVRFEFLQIYSIPLFIICIGYGISIILNKIKRVHIFFKKPFVFIPIGLIICFSLFFSYMQVRFFYNHDVTLYPEADIIQTLTGESDKILVDKDTDISLLYLSDRKGSAHFNKDIEEFRNEGFAYLFTENQTTIENMKVNNSLEVVFENEQFALFKL